jgi:hypothetical protein
MSNPKRKQVAPATPVVGMAVSNVAKIMLIRKFQRIEGNFDCCASAYTRVCKQFECLWRDDCVAMVQD